MSGAKAIDLCRTTTSDADAWGVISAQYVRASGGPGLNPGLQAGLVDGWGPNVAVQRGKRMLALSSGHARTPSMPETCSKIPCDTTGIGTPPPLFPQTVPNCKGSSIVNDDIGLEIELRAPTNATGYRFSFKFYSEEFPYYVCSSFNDQFVALVNPAPEGSIHGNISFDSKTNPVSVNIAFFDVCDPAASLGDFAKWCKMTALGCPSPPNPFCPSGASELLGTGFETPGLGGATSWLETKAPVVGGEVFKIRFAIWDTGDAVLDSTVLIDDFQWIANGGTVPVGTNPIEAPK
jgi:hypothetical protein